MEDNNKPLSEAEKEKEKQYKKDHIEGLKNLIAANKELKESIDSAEFSGGGSGDGTGGKGGKKSSGVPKSIQEAFGKIKNAFANNTTVKFLTNPVGVLGGGLRSAIAPLKNLVPNLDKIKNLGKGLLGGKGGFDKKSAQDLKAELINIRTAIEGQPNYTDQFVALESALGRIETAISGQELTPAESTGLQQDLSNLENLKFESPQFDRFDLRTSAEPQEGILGAQPEAQPGTLNNPNTVNISSESLSNLSSMNAQGIGDSIGNAIKGDDQLKREQERDRILREKERNEDLVGALGGIKLGGDINISGKGGGFGDFFGNIFSAVVGGRFAGPFLAGLGASIKAFLVSVGMGFAKLGAMIKPIALGSVAVGLMGASLFPFIEALKSFGRIENLGKSLAAFAGSLLVLGSAVGILGGIMMTGVGFAALSLGAIALAAIGAAAIPFAGAITLASKGMDSFSNFVLSIGEVGGIGLLGAAAGLTALGTAMTLFSGAGFISAFLPGKGRMIAQLQTLAESGGGLQSVAESLSKINTSLNGIRSLSLDNIGVGKFFKSLDNIIGTYNFKNKIKDIGSSAKTMFQRIAEGMEEIDLDKLSAINAALNSNLSVSSVNIVGQRVASLQDEFNATNRAAVNGAPTAGVATNIGAIKGGDSVTNNIVNTHAQHINSNTLNYLLGAGQFS